MGKTQKVFFGVGSELTDEEREIVKEFSQKEQVEKTEFFKAKADELAEKRKTVNFMTDKFIPYEDRILVYPDPVETVTKGGIYKPDELLNKEKPKIGTVVAIGAGKNGVALPLTVGQKIAYGSYAGTDFTIDEVKYLIMRFADCFGEVK